MDVFGITPVELDLHSEAVLESVGMKLLNDTRAKSLVYDTRANSKFAFTDQGEANAMGGELRRPRPSLRFCQLDGIGFIVRRNLNKDRLSLNELDLGVEVLGHMWCCNGDAAKRVWTAGA
jgi:hypothetical protein